LSTKKKTPKTTSLDAQAVADYLLAHPDFLRGRRKLLTQLSIPHPAGGAVSLVERQVEVLRQENCKLEQRLVDWMEIARANDRLLAHLHELAITLLGKGDPERRLDVLTQRLHSNFGADAAVLVRLGKGHDSAHVRYLPRTDAGCKGVLETLESGQPMCRPLSEKRRERLFPDNKQLASAAFVALGIGAADGFLALASNDPKHFHPSLDTTYLARLGELVSAALAARSS
jgi:uncharacterized protein YigA (DUF484 family)